MSSWPLIWSNDLARRDLLGDCSTCEIHGLQGPVVAPPLGTVHVGQIQCKENQQRGYDETTIQRCRSDIVVLQPPTVVASADEIVEDNADDSPAEVDVDSGGREQANTSKDDWRTDISPERLGPAASQ